MWNKISDFQKVSHPLRMRVYGYWLPILGKCRVVLPQIEATGNLSIQRDQQTFASFKRNGALDV